MIYEYLIRGTAANGQTWEHQGEVEGGKPGEFPDLIMIAMQQSFLALTRGQAVYGMPGVGCHGPYTITHLSLTAKQEKQ